MRTETMGFQTVGERASASRLLDLAYRCATDDEREDLPWHLLSMQAERVVRDSGYRAEPPRAATQRVSLGLALALAERLSGLAAGGLAERLVPWLRPLWRLDRLYGLSASAELGRVLPPATASLVREVTGAALLRMLARRGHEDSPAPLREGGLLRELTALGALPLLDDTHGGADWTVLAHGVFRHVSELVEHEGPAALSRWVRLCPSRTALGYLAGLDLIRHHPLVLGTLLLHGGPREIALGLAALHGAGLGSPVRAALASLVLGDPSLSERRLSYLFDRIGELPGSEPELRDALLARTARSRTPQVAPPYTDELLRGQATGHVEAALLDSGLCPLDKVRPLSERLMLLAQSVLVGENLPGAFGADERWALRVARGLAAAWQHTDEMDRAGLRASVVRSLARVESELNRQARANGGEHPDEVGGALRLRSRALATLAVQLARALPRDEHGASFALALYELALRARQRHPTHLADIALFACLEPLLAEAPDALDAERVDELSDFLQRWRSQELGETLHLPVPESAPVVDGHHLGVASLA